MKGPEKFPQFGQSGPSINLARTSPERTRPTKRKVLTSFTAPSRNRFSLFFGPQSDLPLPWPLFGKTPDLVDAPSGRIVRGFSFLFPPTLWLGPTFRAFSPFFPVSRGSPLVTPRKLPRFATALLPFGSSALFPPFATLWSLFKAEGISPPHPEGPPPGPQV